MTSTTTSRWPWVVPILIYAAATLEMIIMVTPFAAYFYSVYTPLLHGLEASAATAWLPQFFLPHLLVPRHGLQQLGRADARRRYRQSRPVDQVAQLL